jgi:hypothetical protein
MRAALIKLDDAPNRRLVLASLVILLTGCATADRYVQTAPKVIANPTDLRYQELVGTGHRIPAIDAYEIDRSLLRTTVAYKTRTGQGR